MPDNNTRILYLSYDGMTDPLGQSQVLPYICGLSKLGYSFTLISAEKPERFEQNRHIIEKIAAESNIDWQPVMYRKSPPVLSTVFDIRDIRKKTEQLHRQKDFAMLHCRGYITALEGLRMRRRYNTKFLFDMRGFWADEKVDAGAWNLKNPVYNSIYKFFKKKEREFLQEADHTISLTHKGADEMRSWKHVQMKPDSITVIPCCADVDLFDPSKVTEADRNRLKDELGIKPADVIVSYLGSIGTWYMLDEMLDLFAVLKKKVAQARLMFITFDEHERILATAAAKGIARQDIILRPAKRNEVAQVLSLSSFSLFFIRPTYSKMSSSPTKQGEIMAMGIPAICNAGVGDTDTIVQQYGSGVLVRTMSGQGYEDAVTQLLATRFSTEAIREGALEYFPLSEGVSRYAGIYRRVLGPVLD